MTTKIFEIMQTNFENRLYFGTHGHNSYMVSIGKPRYERPLSRPKRRMEATIKPDLKLLDSMLFRINLP